MRYHRTMSKTADETWNLNVRLTVGQREQLHELEATFRREEGIHVTASAIVRAAIDMAFAKPKQLKSEVLKRHRS